MEEIKNKKESKSLAWTVIVLYLSMTIVSVIIMFIVSFIVAKTLPVIINNNTQYLGFIKNSGVVEIGAIILFLVSLVANVIGLKVGVDYIDKRTVIQKINIAKISFWLAIIILIVPLINRLVSKKFNLLDLLIFITAAVVFFATRYFLSKKAIDSDFTTNVSTNI